MRGIYSPYVKDQELEEMNTNPKIWIVRFGDICMHFYTHYHAEQFCTALKLNGTHYTLEEPTS